MGRVLETIDDDLKAFIETQPVFFVSTAPLAAEDHVNVSPKGLDSLRVLGPHRVAYVDLHGSGIETHAHLRENGRICVMFCAFTGPPKVVRLHGRGRAVLPGDDDFDELAARLPTHDGLRAVIDIAVDRVSSSCGFAVPLMDLVEPRDQLVRWADRMGPEKLAGYRAEKNTRSIDGLPGI